MFVADALDVFTRDWTTVTHNYIEFDGRTKPVPLALGDLPPGAAANRNTTHTTHHTYHMHYAGAHGAVKTGESTREQSDGKGDVDTDLLVTPTPEARKKEASVRVPQALALQK